MTISARASPLSLEPAGVNWLGTTAYLYLPIASIIYVTRLSTGDIRERVTGFFHVLTRGQYDRIQTSSN